MWRTERPLSHQSGASGESGDRMNFGQLQRGFEFEWRQDRWQPFRQHCLARTRRPDKQDVMAARRGDFQGSLCRLLSAHLAEIDAVMVVVNQNLGRIYANW